jgi:cytochrome c peroxidase
MACGGGTANHDAPGTRATAAVLATWRADVDTLTATVARLDSLVATLRSDAEVARVQAAFRDARQRFKYAEVALEYYAPSTTRSINGPPVPEVEETEGPEVVLAPSGFQVIGALLFGDDPAAQQVALASEVKTLRAHLARAATMLAAQETTDAHVWDAARLELSRILTLGLAGFDASTPADAFAESRAALRGIARTLAPYRANDARWEPFARALADAEQALSEPTTASPFNYLAFLGGRGRALALALVQTRAALGIGTPAEHRAFRMTAASVFEADAIDPDGFAPLGLDHAPPARIALGRQLFADARLSANGARSCANCHVPALAFTDGVATPRALSGQPLARNTPTILNAGLQVGQFADLRTTYLEDQVTEVVQNAQEMHGSLDAAAAMLRRDSALVARFREAFASTSPDTAVTPLRIRQAVAAYVRSLSRLDAPIDRALRGDTLALSAEARAGFNLYMGKARCATCHFLPLTNGTVPPMYQRSELEVLGVPVRDVAQRGTIDPDVGRHALSRAAPHRYAFRTPTLRNIALTAPYMHNGAFRTLDAVIAFYDRGGGAGIGIALPNQTLPAEPLRLTALERAQLKAFLGALTDTTGLR